MYFMDDMPRLTRREALRRTGLALGAVGLAPLLGGMVSTEVGGGAQPLPTPPSRPAPTREASRVALVRTDDRVSGTRRAVDLLAPEGISGRSVLLKPNLNTGDPAPAATDTGLLEALVQELRNAGSGRITIGDRSGMAVTREAMEAKGILDLAERLDLETVAFDELGADGWKPFPAEGTHWE